MPRLRITQTGTADSEYASRIPKGDAGYLRFAGYLTCNEVSHCEGIAFISFFAAVHILAYDAAIRVIRMRMMQESIRNTKDFYLKGITESGSFNTEIDLSTWGLQLPILLEWQHMWHIIVVMWILFVPLSSPHWEQ